MISALMLRQVERSVRINLRSWFVFASGLLEPVLFLLSIGLGVGALVGRIDGVPYDAYVAPALLAVAAMNAAVIDTTFVFFVNFKYTKTYDAALATPLGPRDLVAGEVTWTLLRGAVYSSAFLVTMLAFGLVSSWWALLAVPAAVLIGFAFATVGIAASTFMRTFIDFDYVNLVIVPLFLFSATFFPIEETSGLLQVLVRCSPLYQGVAIERALVLGRMEWEVLGHAAYLVVMGAVGFRIASRRVTGLLQP